MINDEIFDKIEAWLSGKLSISEAQAFEAAIAQDADLAREVERHRKGREALDQLAAQTLHKKMAAWRETMDELPAPPAELTDRKKSNWLNKVARFLVLPLLIGLVAFWFWPQNGAVTNDRQQPDASQPQQQQELVPPDNPPTTTPAPTPVPRPGAAASTPPKAGAYAPRLIAMAGEGLDGYKNSVQEKFGDRRGTGNSDNGKNTLFAAGLEAFLKERDDKKAESLLAQVREGEPNFSDAQEILAAIYYKQQQYHKAAVCYASFTKKAGSIYTDMNLLYFYLADYDNNKAAFWGKLNEILDPTDPHKDRQVAAELKDALLKMGLSETD